MFFHESDRRVVVLFARHDIERDHPAGLVRDFHHVLDEALHDVDVLRDPDVIHALRVVGAEARAHAAREQHCCQLAFADRLQALCPEFIFSLFDLGEFHRADRGDLPPLDLPADVLRDGEVGLRDLREKCFLLLVAQSIVVVQDVFLTACLKFG